MTSAARTFKVSDIDYDELFDEDEYPSDYALDVVSHFHGTPCQLVELIAHLWRWKDLVQVRAPWRGEIEVSLVTGGWSGNESVIRALDGTVFGLRWWETTKRGGLYVYKVRADDWNSESNLGRFADLNSR